MPSAVKAVFEADGKPMKAEFAKMEVVAKRFGKTMSDQSAAENEQLLKNSNAIKQLIAERAAAKAELTRYNAALEANAGGLATVTSASRAENEALVAKSVLLKEQIALRKAAKSEAERYAGSASQSGGFANPRGSMASDQSAWAEKLAALRARKGASLLTEAGELEKFGKSAMGAGKQALNFKAAMGELVVVAREAARGNWSRIPQSISIVLQRLGLNLVKIFTSIPGLVGIAGAAIAYFTLKRIKDLNEALDKTSELLQKSIGDRSRANYDALKEIAEATADFDSWLSKLGHTQETLADQTAESIAAMREQFDLMRQISGSDHADARKEEQSQRRQELSLINENLEKQKQIAKDSQQESIEAEAEAFGGSLAKERLEKIKSLPAEMDDAREGLKKFTELQKEVQSKVEEKRAPLVDQLMREYQASKGTSRESYAKQQLERAASSAFSSEIFKTKSGEAFSLDMVNGELEKRKNLAKSQQQLQVELEGVQRQLADALKDAKEKAQKDTSAVERLTKERDKLSDEISLHARLDPILSADQAFQQSLEGKSNSEKKRMLSAEIIKHKQNAEFYRSVGDKDADLSASGEEAEVGKLQMQLSKVDAKHARERSLGLTAEQRLGAYAATPPDFKKLVDAAMETARNTAHLRPQSNRPVGAHKANFAPHSHR